MRKRRDFIAMLAGLTLVCVLFCGNSAFGANASGDVVVSMQLNNPIMTVNGIETEIDAGENTAPLAENGRTLVPIRAIIEAFGGTVGWDGAAETVSLEMNDDKILLTVGSNTAYLNGSAYTLDTAPAVINERTMLPIRFIAEGFNLGVAWEDKTQCITIIRNVLDDFEYEYLANSIPQYSGSPYVDINSGTPMFKDYEIIGGSFEYYSELDALGRCNVCMASVSEDIMPSEERGDISSVTPTGWKNACYDGISGRYLYNRCHLIGYQLTGENANERNLITGTRYMNIDGMLPFENSVHDYIEETGNHVMYRVTPFFEENNMVASGVLLEAYSVEDNGEGISFCVYCYNLQPTVIIDYKTGASSAEGESGNSAEYSEVYRTPYGKRYHFNPECGGKNSFGITLEEAVDDGLTPCKKCA